MKKIILALLPTLLITIGFLGYLEYDKANGEDVVLKVVTLDPTDFLRGDYVNLNYEIQRVPKSQFPESLVGMDYGEKICVKLNSETPASSLGLFKKGEMGSHQEEGSMKNICGDYQSSMEMFTEKYNSLSDIEKEKITKQAYNEGEKYNYLKGDKFMKDNGYKEEVYMISFPSINRYFLPKGKGYAIDEAARANKLTALVTLTKSGNTYVKNLQIDGVDVDFEKIEAREQY